MLPTSYEFRWDAGHIAFLGIFYGVLTVVFCTLAVVAYRWLRDLRRNRSAAISWHGSFADLPDDRRHCRHEFNDAITDRICTHEFACDSCLQHAGLATGGDGNELAGASTAPATGRLFHRGHTWVQARSDGTFDVGADDLLQRCFGQPDRITVPGVGTHVQQGSPAAELQRGRVRAHIAAPLTGVVVATGTYDGGTLYRVQPLGDRTSLQQLLGPDEANRWGLREYEMLQERLNPAGAAATLADGGEMVDDLISAYPDADWDAIVGDLCLEP
jgi:hypothetical protein